MDLSRFKTLDIVIVCGLPGSGKSHFASRYFKDTGRNRVNRKEIRRMIFEMTNFGAVWSEDKFDTADDFLVKHVERKIIEHLLQHNRQVLVDNISVSRSSRKIYVDIAKQMRKSIGVIYLHAPVIKCLERNREREDAVPEIVISNLAASAELPDRGEGFQDVLVVEGY